MFLTFFTSLREAQVPVTLREYLTQIEAMGWDKLMETLRQRLAEQKGRHQGGSKWIGTAGTSPFGAYGYNPEGIRIGQDGNRNFRAVKVWDRREFKHMEHFYFHNCLYEKVWKENRRRWDHTTATWDLLHTYPHDYKVIFVGD